MRRKAAIGVVGAINVAALIATSAPHWGVTDVAYLGDIVLSADDPEFPIDASLTIGDGLLTTDYGISAILELEGENVGGAGKLEVWIDDQLVESQAINAGLGEPIGVDLVVSTGLKGDQLDELHLLVKVDGEAELEVNATLTVSADGSHSPPKDSDTTLSIEVL